MIALLALSLGVDAFAVSVSCGMSIPHFKKTRLLWLAGYFGLFQAGMTLLGAFLGGYFSDFAGAFGGVIAFLLLAAIGGEMIWSSLRAREQTDDIRTLTHGRMLVLALATSVTRLRRGSAWGCSRPMFRWPARSLGSPRSGSPFSAASSANGWARACIGAPSSSAAWC
jgi:putative Mn2+ efflux pump MntP